MSATEAKKVVIVGGGFGGVNAAKRLGHRHDIEVTVLDRRNYHLFQPLLYQVAMAGLNPGDIAVPIRDLLSDYRNIRVLMAEAKSVDVVKRAVVTDIGPLPYDYLILACGAQHSYFGHEEWEPHAPGLKTLEQATEIRRRVLLAFEKAERETDPAKREALLTFVVIGGGPTGVELAGALGEMSRYTLTEDFRQFDPRQARIVLLEAGPRILTSFDEDLSERATHDLRNLGVTVRTNTRVTSVTKEGVSIGEEKIEASTVLWGAGVKASDLSKSLGVALDRAGRVIVNEDLSVPGHPEVFVIGDQACFKKDDDCLPGLAPVALQEGHASAENIMADIERRPREAFHYLDKGQMATIGRRKAVVQSGRLKFGGIIAWFAWLFIHILYLVGFKNRTMVLFQWLWSYTTYKRGTRLIVDREWRSFPEAGWEAPSSTALLENRAKSDAT